MLYEKKKKNLSSKYQRIRFNLDIRWRDELWNNASKDEYVQDKSLAVLVVSIRAFLVFFHAFSYTGVYG